ncbi:MAG: hypothetical protein GXO96_01945 [Nitrospirae bacterium]|nr:hypothetical protein [Candidatus Manganitrophaceae bacterium]
MNLFNKNIVLFLLFISFFFGFGCSNKIVKSAIHVAFPPVKSVTSKTFNAQNVDKIAVLVLPNKEMPDRLIEDELIRILIGKGYQVPSRTDIKHILEEMNLQESDLTEDNAAKFGKLLNVPAVLIASLTQFEQYESEDGMVLEATMGGRLISVEESEVLWIGSSSDKNIAVERATDLLVLLSKYMANAIPERIEAQLMNGDMN